MTNPWITHVKEMAKKLNTTYGCALSMPEVSRSYQDKKKGKKVKIDKDIDKDINKDKSTKELQELYEFYYNKIENITDKKQIDKINKILLKLDNIIKDKTLVKQTLDKPKKDYDLEKVKKIIQDNNISHKITNKKLKKQYEQSIGKLKDSLRMADYNITNYNKDAFRRGFYTNEEKGLVNRLTKNIKDMKNRIDGINKRILKKQEKEPKNITPTKKKEPKKQKDNKTNLLHKFIYLVLHKIPYILIEFQEAESKSKEKEMGNLHDKLIEEAFEIYKKLGFKKLDDNFDKFTETIEDIEWDENVEYYKDFSKYKKSKEFENDLELFNDNFIYDFN